MAKVPWYRRSLSDLWSATWSSIGFGNGSAYTATDPRRKIQSAGRRPTNSTANEVLTSSLTQLRAYCRSLERNNPTARAAIEGLVANVVGTGIALEPDTGDEGINKRIRAVWQEFQKDCAVNGHDLFYLQGQGFREIVSAGEILWRLVVMPERVDEGKIPLAVLPLEAEWLYDQAQTAGRPDNSGLVWVGGVGVDKYGRPARYQLRAPGVGIAADVETYEAKDIIHEFERRRALQARGEPWFAPVVETLEQERQLVDAELKSAVNTSAMAMVVTSEAHDPLDTEEDGTTDDPAHAIRLGSVARLYPGDKVEAFAHTRPSQQIAPFRQMLRGDIAASMRIPQRFLDRDVSRANYSSMRADMLDSERLLAPVREWFGHATAGRLYKAALPYLALMAGVSVPRPNYRLIPDGQPYVDPQKDAEAAITAIVGNISTYEQEIGKRGGDYKAVWSQRAREEAEKKALGLVPDANEAGSAEQKPKVKAKTDE